MKKRMKKQEMQDIFKQTNWIRLVFNMTWLMEICLDKQLMIKYYVIKHLILLKILDMIDIKEVYLHWFISFLIKRVRVVLLKMKSS